MPAYLRRFSMAWAGAAVWALTARATTIAAKARTNTTRHGVFAWEATRYSNFYSSASASVRNYEGWMIRVEPHASGQSTNARRIRTRRYHSVKCERIWRGCGRVVTDG